jgi:hypothetical protein
MGLDHSGNAKIYYFDSLFESIEYKIVPASLKLYHHSVQVCLSPNLIFITGGINSDYSEVSSECYCYHPESDIFERLPDMLEYRYTHISTYFRGILYVFGGRQYGDDDKAIIN